MSYLASTVPNYDVISRNQPVVSPGWCIFIVYLKPISVLTCLFLFSYFSNLAITNLTTRTMKFEEMVVLRSLNILLSNALFLSLPNLHVVINNIIHDKFISLAIIFKLDPYILIGSFKYVVTKIQASEKTSIKQNENVIT